MYFKRTPVNSTFWIDINMQLFQFFCQFFLSCRGLTRATYILCIEHPRPMQRAIRTAYATVSWNPEWLFCCWKVHSEAEECRGQRDGEESRHQPRGPSWQVGRLCFILLAVLFQFLIPEAGVLKKLSLAGLAKLSRLRYSWLRFGLASAGYRGLGVHDRPVYTAG